MPYGSRAKQFVDELVGQFRRRALLRNWGRRAVEILVWVRSGRKERVPAKPDAGTLLYLVSLGLVATAVVVVFFGLGFLLLAHPEDEALSAAGLDNRSAEAQASRSSGSPAQSSQAHEQTPPAPTRRTAPGALPDAFANSEVPNTSPLLAVVAVDCSRLRRLVAWVPVIALVFGPIFDVVFRTTGIG